MFWLSRALAFALIPILVSGLLTLMRIPKKAEMLIFSDYHVNIKISREPNEAGRG